MALQAKRFYSNDKPLIEISICRVVLNDLYGTIASVSV